MRGGSARIVAASCGVATGLIAVTVALRAPAYSFGGDWWGATVAGLLAGWGLVAAGVLAWRARPGRLFGPVLVLAGAGWFLLEWDNPGAGWPVVFTAGLALHAVCVPVLAHALFGYPDRGLGWPERSIVAAGYAVAIGLLGLVPALGFDPGPQGCPACPDNLLALGSAPGLGAWSLRAELWLGIAWCVVVIIVLGRRVARSTVAGRRLLLPVLLPGIVYIGLSGLAFLLGLWQGFPSNDPAGRVLWLGQAAALTAVAAGAGWERLRAWRTRTAVARLVVNAARTSPGGLRDALAAMLGDSALAVLFPLPDGRSVDVHGRAARPRPGQAVTRLSQGDTVVALLAHREGLLDDPGLAGGITSLARLALHTERLRAETLVQLADLRASRARIVDVADAERRRLERDLHDGVQQRLVALALAIRLARMRNGVDERLARAEREVRDALADLREIAHGLCPAILAEEGLAAGLEALAEGLPVRLRLDGLPRRRFDRSIESAAYLVVAETVKRSGCTEATVRMSDGGERLMIAIEVRAGEVGEVTDLRDRVGAVNGSLRLDGGRDAWTVRAEFPCAS